MHAVPESKRVAIYEAVHWAGVFAWDENARNRKAGLIRILPADRQKVDANTLWPSISNDS